MLALPFHSLRRDSSDSLPALQRLTLRPLRFASSARHQSARRNRPRSR